MSAIRKKLIIVGYSDCGKTCLLSSFACNKFPEEFVPSVFGRYAACIKVDDKTVELGFFLIQ